MRKGQRTKRRIIADTAGLFNSHGYFGTPLSEITRVTGVEKGGIYNHFSTKAEMHAAAFRYAVERLIAALEERISSETDAVGRLRAIIEFYRHYALNPLIEGGCPLLNAIVDADNRDPFFQKEVHAAVLELTRRLSFVLKTGIRKGELRRDTDPDRVAVFILASIEGGIAICRSSKDQAKMDAVADHLHQYIDNQLVR